MSWWLLYSKTVIFFVTFNFIIMIYKKKRKTGKKKKWDLALWEWEGSIVFFFVLFLSKIKSFNAKCESEFCDRRLWKKRLSWLLGKSRDSILSDREWILRRGRETMFSISKSIRHETSAQSNLSIKEEVIGKVKKKRSEK